VGARVGRCRVSWDPRRRHDLLTKLPFQPQQAQAQGQPLLAPSTNTPPFPLNSSEYLLKPVTTKELTAWQDIIKSFMTGNPRKSRKIGIPPNQSHVHRRRWFSKRKGMMIRWEKLELELEWVKIFVKMAFWRTKPKPDSGGPSYNRLRILQISSIKLLFSINEHYKSILTEAIVNYILI
jgi:hypothetical protein